MSRLSQAVVKPSFIRAVMHDASDLNNLVDEFENPVNLKGGIDFCLQPTLDQGEADPGHNTNLGRSISKCVKAQKKMNQFQGVSMSRSDALVLGAIIAIEYAGGPQIDVYWGRKDGPCKKPIACTRSEIVKNGECGEKQFNSQLSPSGILLKGFEPHKLRQIWQDFGFDAWEQVALQGSHTFGNVHECAVSMGGVERGNQCPIADKFKCNYTQKGVEYGIAEADRSKWCDAHNNLVQFGDGAQLDRTPETFDNDYFEMLRDTADQEDKNKCCGRITKDPCRQACVQDEENDKCENKMVQKKKQNGKVITAKGNQAGCTNGRCIVQDNQCVNKNKILRVGHNTCNKQQQPQNLVSGQTYPFNDLCKNDFNWCRDDQFERTHMKSTQMQAISKDPNFVKYSDRFGNAKRIMKFSCEWSILGLDETKDIMRKYADDQDLFFKKQRQAFEKLQKYVPEPEKDELYRCEIDKCISCNNKTTVCGPDPSCPSDQQFKFMAKEQTDQVILENCELPAGKTCELVGGLGIKAKIECEGEVMYCDSVCQGEMCDADDEADREEEDRRNKKIEIWKKKQEEADKEEFGNNGPTLF